MSSATSPVRSEPHTALLRTERIEDGSLVLHLSGWFDSRTTARAWDECTRLLKRSAPNRLIIQASELNYCDGAGIGLIFELRDRQQRAGHIFELRGLASRYQSLLDMFAPDEFSASSGRRTVPLGIAEKVGRDAYGLWNDIRTQIEFIGQMTVAVPSALLHPTSVRWREVWAVSESAGANALPIIALVGFLMGLIMAFQSAVPMGKFGADIFVADLIGISMVKELGPLLTAIVLAGRSGSAFAAEIGAMKVNEEVNALTTMGIDPVRFLMVTRVIAATAMTPLLALFAELAGLIGGAVVMLSLHYPLITYVNRVAAAVDTFALFSGLFKAVIFGLLVAGIGCLRGLQTRSGAGAVGASTTRAVVSGIVLIAIADGIFSVLFYYIEVWRA